jgi:hypothetical protein
MLQGRQASSKAMAIPMPAVGMLAAAPATVRLNTEDSVPLSMERAAANAADYVTHRFGRAVLDQAAAFPLNQDGSLADTVDSAWHFGFWCERQDAQWSSSYVAVRLEPSGGPDARPHERFQATPDKVQPLDLARCLSPVQAIAKALHCGLTGTEDPVFHVLYFAASEGQPSMIRVSSHRGDRELDHRCLAPDSGRMLPPPVKAKRERPLLNR